MKLLGLIGYPLDHSFSAAFFTAKFASLDLDFQYRLFPLPNLETLPSLINQHPELIGLNVTIPHKINILPLLNEVKYPANQCGAVNTLCISRPNAADPCTLVGYNTDVEGFKNSLQAMLSAWHKQALVLGSGGASRAVCHVLQELQIPFRCASRQVANGANLSPDQLNQLDISDINLIINTTPLGQLHQPGNPLPAALIQQLSEKHLCYDLVYNPPETEFLVQAKRRGAATINGLEMLKQQAEASWTIWKQHADSLQLYNPMS